MRSAGLFLAIGLSLLVVLVLGVFIFFPTVTPPKAVIIVPVDPTISQMEQALTEQESAYQAQLATLQQTLARQETGYRNQIEALQAEIAAARQQLNDLKRTEQELLIQLQELETSRAGQKEIYRANLQQTQEQHTARQSELNTQLERVQAELARLTARLGR
ncbi:MAG: hypothetical protein AB1801_10990 [Chloroflexota bacterium]